MKLFVAPLVLAATLLFPLPPAYAAGETCNGLAATIVGTPGATLAGTPGPDVVITNGASRVDAGAGDDTICTTGTVGTDASNYAVVVLAGDGNDVVDRRGDTGGLANGQTDLGAGTNALHGSPAGDLVSSKAGASDTIATGDGRDNVVLTYAAPQSAEVDAVDLGAGEDNLFLDGGFSTGLALTGGADLDTLWIEDTPTAPWTLDAAAGRLRVGAVPYLAFADFDAYRVFGQQRLDFVGSDRDEQLWAATRLGSVAMAGGDDELVHFPRAGRTRPVLDGGAGTDRLELEAEERLAVDLQRGRLEGSDRVRGRLSGFEEATVRADRVSLAGTKRADTLVAVGCRTANVSGERGDDVLEVAIRPKRRCNGAEPRVQGGPGADTIKGSRVADVLVGGPGEDTADGAGGRDDCRSVEHRTRC